MGLMNSALQIGRSAILSYQSALQVVGNNISSVGSPDYTRLVPGLDPMQGPVQAGGLQPGAGVALSNIQRNIDESLEARLRLAVGQEESLIVQQNALAQVEMLFADTSGMAVSARLTTFFNSLDEVQNTPEDQAIRGLAVNNGALLAESLQTLRGQLAYLGDGLDRQIADLVVQADGLAQQIAGFNEQISAAEAGVSGQATGLRDQRDAALRELSRIFDVTIQQQSDGALNVYVGSEALVQGNVSRSLVAVEEADGTFTRTTIRFADTNAQINAQGGQLHGLVVARDEHAFGQIQAIDDLAAALIAEVNRIHADGQGLVAFTSVTGTYAVNATDQPLDGEAAGLPFPADNGSFYITVADDVTGTPVAYRIEINPSDSDSPTTLQSLVETINSRVDGVAASITSDNRLSLSADAGYSFSFGHDGHQAREDTSHVLAALGINTFFTGEDARDIAVNDTLAGQPSLLAASSTFLSGDGSMAGRIVSLSTQAVSRLGETSLTGYYTGVVNSVAVITAGIHEAAEAADAVRASLHAQRESISGVNLDEEAIALLKYERAFQGASRFISVVDGLLRDLISIIR